MAGITGDIRIPGERGAYRDTLRRYAGAGMTGDIRIPGEHEVLPRYTVNE